MRYDLEVAEGEIAEKIERDGAKSSFTRGAGDSAVETFR
jgi:hypothetical protein